MPPTRFVVPTCLAVGLALAGCSADTNYARDLAYAVGVTGGEPKPAPDFVTRSRSTNGDYVPIGTSAPKRDLRTKSAGEVSGAEQELDTSRAGNEAKAAVTRQAPRAQ